MKKISILFDPSSNGITKGTSRAYGIVLDEAPSSDVTVSFSATNSYVTFSSSLTFTTSNYNTPQAVTISATADGIVEGKKLKQLYLRLLVVAIHRLNQSL